MDFKELLYEILRALLLAMILVAAVLLLTECGIRKNIDTTVKTYDSTQVTVQKAEVEIKATTVDTTQVTDDEVIVKITDYYEPTIVDGVVVADHVRSVREEIHRRKTEQKGEAVTIELQTETQQEDSVSVATVDNKQITTNVDTKAGTKRFFLAFSFLFLVLLAAGIGYLAYLKFIR